MSLAVAIQMDPMDSININADSTFVLALEAQRRGHALFHYLPTDLALKNGRVMAWIRPLQVRRELGNHFTLDEPQLVDLATMDVVLMRQDPPFDMAYITATHLLEHIHPATLVVNDPVHVRNAPEKLLVTHFPGLMPPTLITTDRRQIMEFRKEFKDLVIKPLFGNGGAGVFHVKPDDENLNSLLEMFTQLYREPVMVQQYLPAVRQGDKRIILVDGKAAGAVNRVPQAGEARSNLHVGGTAMKAELTARDREICDAIGPTLRARGLVFVGIDVIGTYLTEINVTSPTGIQEINRFDDVRVEAQIWDAIELRRAATAQVPTA
ncbi:glutathione synthase [Magnetospirillum gryphiswaldense]|uniref:glutathione synthase n=1 Tax=Magnetospirillum gryphiswaldense TaxID=55518 RepID=UPI000326ADC2|nr:glutathione synthase [Magnetospirillum gryphiswaldense]AVM75481.1 Glutathione synthetase [Magnetospirillum gryphiswaldense MSR-1]AVM79384.1 Glutathione synthetase [Magnetospirillum gryphiswaldense]